MKNQLIGLFLLLCMFLHGQKKTNTNTLKPLAIINTYDRMSDKTIYLASRNIVLYDKNVKFDIMPLIDIQYETKLMTMKGLSVYLYGIKKCVKKIEMNIFFENNESIWIKSFEHFNCNGDDNMKIDSIDSNKLMKYQISTVRIEDFDLNYMYNIELNGINRTYFIDLFSKINEYNKTIKSL